MKKLVALLLVVVLIIGMPVTAHAAKAVESIEAFVESENPMAQNINSDNYYLDIMELGIFDAGTQVMNNLANVLFTLEIWIVRMTGIAFYYATSSNFADLLAMGLDATQGKMKTNVFDGLFALAVSFSGFFVAWLLMKRNMQGVINHFLKIIITVFGVTILAANSSSVFKTVDSISQAVSNTIMSAISGQQEDSVESYGVTTAAALWKTLIHDPWIYLEFGNSGLDKEKNINDILGISPQTTDRQNIIDDLVGDKDNPQAFGKDMPTMRLPFIILHLIPLNIKCAIFLLIAVLQLAFRLMTLLMLLLGILVLTLSIVPQFGGTRLISKWLGKVFEMQIMVVLLSMTLAFITLIDNLIYTGLIGAGWFIVLVLQTLVDVVIFMFRTKILGFFAQIQTIAQNPAEAITKASARGQAALAGTGTVFQSAQNFNQTLSEGVAESARISMSAMRNATSEAGGNSDYYGGNNFQSASDRLEESEQQILMKSGRPELTLVTGAQSKQLSAPEASAGSTTQTNAETDANNKDNLKAYKDSRPMDEEYTPAGIPSSQRPMLEDNPATQTVENNAIELPEMQREESSPLRTENLNNVNESSRIRDDIQDATYKEPYTYENEGKASHLPKSDTQSLDIPVSQNAVTTSKEAVQPLRTTEIRVSDTGQINSELHVDGGPGATEAAPKNQKPESATVPELKEPPAIKADAKSGGDTQRTSREKRPEKPTESKTQEYSKSHQKEHTEPTRAISTADISVLDNIPDTEIRSTGKSKKTIRPVLEKQDEKATAGAQIKQAAQS